MRFLGLDCSTQSLTGLVIEIRHEADDLALSRGERIWERAVVFDRDLPHWETHEGVLAQGPGDVAHSPPLMWVEALEVLLDELSASGPDPKTIRAITGSGQQHGSVYLTRRFATALAEIDATTAIAPQLQNTLARATSPIWQDTSTSAECSEIERRWEASKPSRA